MIADFKERVQLLRTRLEKFGAHRTVSVTSISDLEISQPAKARFDAPIDEDGWLPFSLGMTWGGKNVWAYFRGTLSVPADWTNGSIDLILVNTPNYLESTAADNFPAGPEGQVFIDGLPAGAIDKEHSQIRWTFEPGREYSITVVAFAARCANQITLDQFEATLVDPIVESLYYDLDFALKLAASAGDDSYSKYQLADAVADALLETESSYGRPSSPLLALAHERFVTGVAKVETVVNAKKVLAVGQAHIDLAWQWPLSTGRHKVARTFATQLRLLEQYPSWTFLQPSPQVYRWLEIDAPALFEKINGMIKSGRWEVEGGMWVEPDANLPSGECLVRQLLYGKSYFRTRFGKDSRCVFLPDTFGFPAALPQLFRLAGIDGFVTTKLSWNETNRFPYDAFRWRGIDGTEVPSYFVTTMLGASPTPDQVEFNWHEYKQKDTQVAPLLTFGHGDGGGGPTPEMLECGARMNSHPGISGSRGLRYSSLLEFVKAAEPYVDTLPVWNGELYLERHRGTYTTHGFVKRENRRNASKLHALELLQALSKSTGLAGEIASTTELWENHLMLQFHDILPGSSVGEVYDEVRPLYQNIAETSQKEIELLLSRLSANVDTSGYAKPVLLFNVLSWDRSEVVSFDNGGEILVRVPANGWAVVEGDLPPTVLAEDNDWSIAGDGLSLVTPFWEVTFGGDGSIIRLFDKLNFREVLAPHSCANEWQLFPEAESENEAWDIAYETLGRRSPGPVLSDFSINYAGASGIDVTVGWSLPKSRISQVISFYRWSPRIDFRTHVDWHERHFLLKAAFPVDVYNRVAAFEIQFGHFYRPTHRNTSWEKAQFEVCAQRWIDLSDSSYGVALMSDCKQGFDVLDNVMRISCLRGTTSPDAHADEGEHQFTYSLLPHAGTLQDANVIQTAAELNNPLLQRIVDQSTSALPSTFSLVSSSNSAVVIDTIKIAEDGCGIIIRLYESFGGHANSTITLGLPAEDIQLVNLLEENIDSELGALLKINAPNSFDLRLRAFQIVTVRVLIATSG